MQGYDVFMIVVLICAAVFGGWKGMAWQVASMASLVASYFVSLKFSTPIAPLFGDEEPWNRFLAMLVLYMGTSLVIWVAFRFVGGAIDRLKLKEFDRQIGALFGLAKGVLLCVAITLFAVSLLPAAQRDKILTSKSGYYIAILLDRSDAVMPPGIHDIVHPYIHTVQQQLDPKHAHGGAESLVEDAEDAAENLLRQAIKPNDGSAPIDR